MSLIEINGIRLQEWLSNSLQSSAIETVWSIVNGRRCGFQTKSRSYQTVYIQAICYSITSGVLTSNHESKPTKSLWVVVSSQEDLAHS